MAKDRMDREERKQLKGPDEFVTTATGIIQWAQENLQTVLLGVGAALAVFIGIGVFTSYQAAQSREANADLAGALDAFRGGQYADAAAALGALAERDAAVAPLAAVVAANSKLREGDPDGAISALQGLDTSGLPPYLRQQIQIAWGNALETKGDLSAAAAKYAEAASSNGPFAGDALVAQARVRGRAGEADAAAELYKKALDDHPERADRLFLEAQAG